MRSRTKIHTVIIRLIVTEALLLFPIVYWAVQTYRPSPYAPTSISVDELLDKMGSLVSSPNYEDHLTVDSLFPLLLSKGQESDGQANLEKAAKGNDVKAVYALFALFKLRNQPDVRLGSLLDRMNPSNGIVAWKAGNLIGRHMDPCADELYIPILLDALATAQDRDTRKALLSCLSSFAYDQRVIEAITSAARSSDEEAGLDAVNCLGLAVEKIPGLKGERRITNALYSIHADLQVSTGIRNATVGWLAGYGWSPEVESLILELHRSKIAGDRIQAIGAAQSIPEIGKALKLLAPMLFDKDPEAVFQATASIFIIAIPHIYWPIVIILAISIVICLWIENRMLRKELLTPAPSEFRMPPTET
jgi:hypothetical protein